MSKHFLFAVATLVGAIVGLGMFGIPYAVSRAGFFVGIGYIIVLGAVALLLHLIYGEVVERTHGKHRLTGYTEKYLGLRWKKVVGLTIALSIYGALLAYIIVGGKFLSLLFPGVLDPFIFGIIFWFALSLLVWRGVRTVGWVELLMTGLLLVFVIIIFIWGAGDVRSANLPATDVTHFFLPYGVVLFALAGSLAIPEIRELITLDGKQYKRAIIIGSLIPVVIYLLFTFLVVGVSGANTSEEALQGLVGYLGAGIVRLGALFGILALATSYLVLGLNLKHTFEYDWNLRGALAGLLAVGVPLALFVAGFQQFITVISVSGAVLGAIIGIVILLIYQKAKKEGENTPGYTLTVPRIVIYGLMTLLALGGVYEIIYLLV